MLLISVIAMQRTPSVNMHKIRLVVTLTTIVSSLLTNTASTMLLTSADSVQRITPDSMQQTKFSQLLKEQRDRDHNRERYQYCKREDSFTFTLALTEVTLYYLQSLCFIDLKMLRTKAALLLRAKAVIMPGTKPVTIRRTEDVSIIKIKDATMLRTKDVSMIKTKAATMLRTKDVSMIKTKDATMLRTKVVSMIKTKADTLLRIETAMIKTMKSLTCIAILTTTALTLLINLSAVHAPTMTNIRTKQSHTLSNLNQLKTLAIFNIPTALTANMLLISVIAMQRTPSINMHKIRLVAMLNTIVSSLLIKTAATMLIPLPSDDIVQRITQLTEACQLPKKQTNLLEHYTFTFILTLTKFFLRVLTYTLF
ncbi:hypothetical protein BgiBS90_023428 [Biomphalaria glabrata]|nr:hypothetical protein BgiBS90_023428 [Biomphalaria glabrata]